MEKEGYIHQRLSGGLKKEKYLVNLGVDVVELVVMTFEDTDFIICYCDVVVCTELCRCAIRDVGPEDLLFRTR